MIDFLFNLVLFVPNQILDAMDPVSAESLSFTDDMITYINNVVNFLGYLLPMKLIFAIISSRIALQFARIGMALFRRIKSIIPTLGE